MYRSTFSTTTIASSTTIPIASTRPNNVNVLIEKPSRYRKAKVPTTETGTAIKWNDRRAPGLQEQNHDQNDQNHGLDERVTAPRVWTGARTRSDPKPPGS